MRALLSITLIACAAPPPSTDAGADPDINACCWRVAPSEIRSCFQDRAAEISPPGECRYLRCLGGLETFTVCQPNPESP